MADAPQTSPRLARSLQALVGAPRFVILPGARAPVAAGTQVVGVWNTLRGGPTAVRLPQLGVAQRAEIASVRTAHGPVGVIHP